MVIPGTVVSNRQDICASCTSKCAPSNEGRINFSEPRHSCPKAKWSCYGDCKNPPLPPAAEIAVNAGLAGYRAASSVLLGRTVKVSDDEQSRRLEICAACEWFNAKQERCSRCGCYTAAKSWLKTEKCPVGKW